MEIRRLARRVLAPWRERRRADPHSPLWLCVELAHSFEPVGRLGVEKRGHQRQVPRRLPLQLSEDARGQRPQRVASSRPPVRSDYVQPRRQRRASSDALQRPPEALERALVKGVLSVAHGHSRRAVGSEAEVACRVEPVAPLRRIILLSPARLGVESCEWATATSYGSPPKPASAGAGAPMASRASLMLAGQPRQA